MSLTRRLSVLLSPDLYERTERMASQTGRSLGDLVREALERLLNEQSESGRLAAVERLASLNLPVGTPDGVSGQIERGRAQ
jgi:predicted DNA-binding protein